MKKGEVWRVRMPGGAGHAQAGERPAVVIQNDPMTTRLATVLIVAFTSQKNATKYPGTVLIQPDSQNGLTVPSVALVFQTIALDKSFFLSRYGSLDPAHLQQVLALLVQLTH
jgi:mRNA-degrading endonuclease toxin of MazEF toxin-antitoxin module